MKKPLEIEINQNYLWDDSQYSYVWPYCLAKADPDREYTTEDLKRTVFGMVIAGSSKANRFRDVLGLEFSGPNRVQVKGISLFERGSEGYRMTTEAKEIAMAYTNDASSDLWKILLIQQVLKYDVRVRAVIYYMGALSYSLETGSPTSTTATPTWRTGLVKNDSAFYLFEKTTDGHIVDIIDFIVCLQRTRDELGIPAESFERFSRSVYALCMISAANDQEPVNMQEQTEILSTVSALAKAIAYVAHDLVEDRESKELIKGVRLSLVPYYFTEGSLGKRASSLRSGESSISEYMEDMTNQIASLTAEVMLTEVAEDKSSIPLVEQLLQIHSRFQQRNRSAVMNMMIDAHKRQIIGPYILDQIRNAGIDVDREILLRGPGTRFALEPPFSRNMFSIPKAIDLLRDLDMIVYDHRMWTINRIAAARLDHKLITGLLSTSDTGLPIDDAYRLQVLRKAFEEMRSDYVPVRKIQTKVCERLAVQEAAADFFCRMIRGLEQKGMIEVKYRHGLPMHGAGLCGDPKQRRLHIAFPDYT